MHQTAFRPIVEISTPEKEDQTGQENSDGRP